MEVEVALLLGADLGDPRQQLAAAETALGERVGKLRARSRDHWTEAWGFRSEAPFLNVAVLVGTLLSPRELLQACLSIEHALGRTRTGGAPASRLIDIDILAYGDRVVEEPDLTIPHPRLHLRRFALAPLADILPGWPHPTQGRVALDLLNAVPRE